MAEITAKDFVIENVISNAIKIPLVKVDRNNFLKECFATKNVDLDLIVEEGPVKAGCSQEMLSQIANKIVLDRTSKSSLMSFVAGVPGGLAMAATIPADMLQFFGVALRLAQEISYLYGAEDLWENGSVDNEKVNSQLIMYLGTMFGVSGAVSSIRFISSQVAKQTLKKLPQQALTKTVWYPVVKQIGKLIGIKVTKSTVAKGVSKAIPIVGGFISGGLNFASMLPMGKRLIKTLDEAIFEYDEETAQQDYEIIMETQEEYINDKNVVVEKSTQDKLNNLSNNINSGFSKFKSKVKEQAEIATNKIKKEQSVADDEDVFEKIEKLSKLKDMGALTEEEFNLKKSELLSKI